MKTSNLLLKARGCLFLIAATFLPFFVLAQTTETITFTFSMSDFTFETDAQGQVHIASDKYDLVFGEDLAKPAIPFRTVSMLAKPAEVYSNVLFTYSGAVKKSNVRLASNPEQIEVGADPGPVVLASYPNGTYPSSSERGYFLMQGLMDGHRILNFKFSPFLYNATTRELTLYTTVTMRVTTKVASYDVPESKGSMNGLIPRLVENAEKEKAYYPGTIPSVGTYEWGPGYLIICPEELREAFEPLRQWKMEKGLYARTRTLEDIYSAYEGETEAIKIKRCIQDYYLHNGLKYVLLGGNGAKVPVVYCGSSEIPSDWFYACLDDSEEFSFDWNADEDELLGEVSTDKIDLYPEVVVSRAPMETLDEVEAFVNKTLAYEQNPPQGDWYNDILFTGVRLGEPDEGLNPTEETSQYLYENYIEPSFPADMQTLFGNKFFDNKNEPTCLDVEEFQAKIQEGFHIIHLIAHGDRDKFCLSAKTGDKPEGREYYTITHAMQMKSDVPCLFVALSCWTNDFGYSKNMSRYLLKNPNNGVFAYIGTTRSSWVSGSNHVYSDGIIRFHYSLFHELYGGENIGKLGLSYTMSKVDNIDDVNHAYMFNMCGDPETQLYLSVPKQFAHISISFSEGKFLVDAGVDSCTFAVRYTRASGVIYKREYRENVRAYEISSGEIENCEITLMHDDYIPRTFTINPEYIQNVTYSGTVNVFGDVIVAGREITDKKPVGDVIIQSGKTTFSAEKSVILAPGFEVKKGASFEAKIKK